MKNARKYIIYIDTIRSNGLGTLVTEGMGVSLLNSFSVTVNTILYEYFPISLYELQTLSINDYYQRVKHFLIGLNIENSIVFNELLSGSTYNESACINCTSNPNFLVTEFLTGVRITDVGAINGTAAYKVYVLGTDPFSIAWQSSATFLNLTSNVTYVAVVGDMVNGVIFCEHSQEFIINPPATTTTTLPTTTTTAPLITTTTTGPTTTTTTLCISCYTGYTATTAGNCVKYSYTAATSGGSIQIAYAQANTAYSKAGSLLFGPGYNLNGTTGAGYTGITSSLWRNYPNNLVNGPLNRTALWTSPPSNNQDMGFSVCIDIAEEKTYYVGMGSDNYSKLHVDGVPVIIQDQAALTTQFGWSTSSPFAYWYIYPITLAAGSHIIEMIGHNVVGPAGMGAEIYDATPEEIVSATGYTAFSASSIIFSTRDMRGQYIQIGNNGTGYQCPDGWALVMCDGPPYCKKIEYLDCGATP